MTGVHLKYIRGRLGVGRQDFALLLGYTGTDRNNENRVKRLEAEYQVPLYIGRLLWLMWDKYEQDGELPHWPEYLHISGRSEPWM